MSDLTEQEIKEIREIDVLKDLSWHSSHFEHMTDEQMVAISGLLYSKLMEAINNLNGEEDIFSDYTKELIGCVLKDFKRRLEEAKNIKEQLQQLDQLIGEN